MRALSDIAPSHSATLVFCDMQRSDSHVPWNGIYISAGALVCFFCMAFDLVHGIIHKKPFVPCKLFYMNALSMTMLGIATKIPVDLTTKMPKVEEQLSKLTSTALLCTSLGFYMPSLGAMGTTERYGNLGAMSVTVITIVVKLFMQMVTCVITEFKIQHFIIMVCVLILLLLMWSSAIAFRGQTEFWPTYYRSRPSLDPNNAKDMEGLRKLLLKFHVLNYTGNPQTLLCETSHHHTIAFLCVLSTTVVLQATLSSFSKFGGSESSDYQEKKESSDYGWSIPYIIVAQLLSIVVGTFSIIYRWLSFVIHTNDEDVLWAHKQEYSPERELEHLKLKTLSFRLPNVFLVAKDSIMDLLIHTQIMLYTCSSCIIGFPIYTVKNFLEFIFADIFHENTKYIDNMLKAMSTSVSEISLEFALSSVGESFDTWISKMAMKDMMSWTQKGKQKYHPDQLIELISRCDASKSECAIFENLEAEGKTFFERFHNKDKVQKKYRVSCVSVLVLSGMLAELMPSSCKESLKQSLNESFEIIDYVDRKNTDPSMGDETRWTSTKELWAQWENSNHWFRTEIISPVFKKTSDKDARGVLKDALQVIDKDFKDVGTHFIDMKDAGSLASKHKDLIKAEVLIISKFIGAKRCESDKVLFDFLKDCYMEMLCYFLFRLPLAILNEIHGDVPTQIGEDKVTKALEFLGKLEFLSDKLGNKIKWSWPIDHASQAKADLTPEVARDCGSVIEHEVSTVVLDADAAANSAEGDDGDAIREIRSQ